ncbi:MAG: MerR family transcriptional regulator [Oscillospiraceae bacterium]|nr:MerR family transcriptional regulator [Oscillospiraceae bacterium]
MQELIKIRDVSDRYDISARTLRYYEDMGLLTSTRGEDYAYRLYDQAAVQRLEQILILRKLNISIRDIQRIFAAPGSGVVLEVLEQKVQNIDDEVALLHELKEVVLEFIREIERRDFGDNADIKLLYEKAKDVETHLANVDYIGKPANVGRLLDVTEKLARTPEVHVVKLPKFRALSSGYDTLENLIAKGGEFDQWLTAHDLLTKPIIFNCADFLWHENGKSVWIWAIADEVTEADTAPYEIIEFEGGLYAAAVSVDGDDDICGRVYGGIKKWIEASGFEPDERPGHQSMCNMIYPLDEIKKALGYHQLEIYVPIKVRGEHQ